MEKETLIDLDPSKIVTVHDLFATVGSSNKYQKKVILKIVFIYVIIAFFNQYISFIFKTPKFLCPIKDSSPVEYKICSENQACKYFDGLYKVQPPKFESISYKYNLFCERSHIKSIMLNLIYLITPAFQFFLMIISDRFGRKYIMIIAIMIGLIGTFVGMFVNELLMLTICMIFIFTFYSTLFGLSFIYINEILIDPYRSKASGFSSFSITIGTLSNCS